MPPSSAHALSALELAQVRLGEIFVHTRSHAHALKQMQICINRYLRYGQPSGFILAGESGTGKTRTLRELEAWVRKTHPEYADHKHLFLTTDLPANCTPKSLGSALLEAAGDAFADRSLTQTAGERRVRKMFKEVDPMTAVMDEAQNAFDRKTHNEITLVCQALKNYWNICERPMILAGMPGLLHWVPSSEELDQRFQNFAILPVYTLIDPELVAEFRDVLTHFGTVVPFADDVDLTDDVTVLRMLLASGGILRRLRQLCIQACEVAEIRGDDRVDLMHLSQGFRNLLRAKTGVPDPFVLDEAGVKREASREYERQKRQRDHPPPPGDHKPRR